MSRRKKVETRRMDKITRRWAPHWMVRREDHHLLGDTHGDDDDEEDDGGEGDDEGDENLFDGGYGGRGDSPRDDQGSSGATSAALPVNNLPV